MVLKNPSKYQKDKTIVFFVRHAERIPIPGTPHPHDFSLSKIGKKQARAVAGKFSKIKKEIDVLYTSPMKRAYETAVEIGKKINKKPIVLKGFEEIRHRLLKSPNILSKKYWKERIVFRKKQKIFDKILEQNKGKVIVIVAHGGLNRLLLGRKLGLSHKKSNMFDTNNCHIALVRFVGKKLDYIHYINSNNLIKC